MSLQANTLFAELIIQLKADGLPTASKKLDYLLRDISWNSDLDFLAGFGREMKQTKETCWERMSAESQQAFLIVAQRINRSWPELGL